jgi:hypothetical protein
MATKLGLLGKKELDICSEIFHKYPKPIKFNNTIGTVNVLLTFYNGLDENGKKYYEYMNPERMVSLLYQIIKNTKEKPETKESAIRMLEIIYQKIVVN